MTWPPEPNNRLTGGGSAGGAPGDPARPADDERTLDADHERTLDAADALARLASDARVDERVAQRRALRWLRRQAEESTTFAGVLDRLLELGAAVAVVTAAGATHRGVVVLVGADAVVLRSGEGRHVVVATAAIAALDAGARPAITDDGDEGGGALEAAAGGLPTDRPTLRELLADLAEEPTDAVATLRGGATVAGRLCWVGDDVAVWALTAGGASDRVTDRIRYVRLSSVLDVSFNVSG